MDGLWTGCGRVGDFLVEEAFSVTLGLKRTLEREPKSLFWVSSVSHCCSSLVQTYKCQSVGMKAKRRGRLLKVVEILNIELRRKHCDLH